MINVGSGREISVGDLARLIIGLVGSKSDVVEDVQRVRPANSEVERLLCDHAKATRLLGWTPQVGLEEGLKRTIEWCERHAERFKPDLYNV